jgi:glutathione synthase/RimK-type ligase-like ATP-grasp enzyme
LAVQTAQPARPQGARAQLQGAKLRPINVLSGVPDSRRCEITINQTGAGLIVSLPGTTNLLQFIPRDVFSLNVQNLGPLRPIEAVRLKPGPILNHISDADLCGAVLTKAEELVARTGRACFNHPTSVKKSTRDGVAEMLQGIKGLIAPRTIRHEFNGEEGLAAAIADAGLTYPLLVRIAGDHGGVSLIKIDKAEELVETRKLNAYGRTVYATQFVDFKSADGRYRKFRLAVVGGEQILVRHMLIGDDWLLHAGRRGKDTVTEEARMLLNFDREMAPKIRDAVLEIARRIDLDHFGIDCNIAPDGTITLFEANACMNIMSNTQASPNMWDAPIANIRRAVMTLLASPRKWRYPPKQTAALT